MPIPKKIDPNAQYEVTLSAPITIGKRVLAPRFKHTIKGSVLEANRDAVIDAVAKATH